MSDSITGGMAVDVTTGLPLPKRKAEKEKFEEDRLESEMAAGFEAEQKLKTKSGKLFIGLVEKAVQRRIEELVNKDSEAQALLGLLDKLGRDIQLGQAAAERLTRIRLGRQAREGTNIG